MNQVTISQRMIGSTAYIVAECKRCGESESHHLPMTVTAFAAWAKFVESAHETCVVRRETNGY